MLSLARTAASRTVALRPIMSLSTTATANAASPPTPAPNVFGFPSLIDLFKDTQLGQQYETTKGKYTLRASDDTILRTKTGLEKKGVKVTVVENGAEALEILKRTIPKGADVSSVGSTTLREIGYIDYSASGKAEFTDLRGVMAKNKDPSKDAELRARRSIVKYSLGSASAVAETGEIFIVDATLTRIPVTLTAEKALLIVGSNKICPTRDDAWRRVKDWAYYGESARCRAVYKNAGSSLNNSFVFENDPTSRIHVVLVKESLGY